MNQEFIDFFVAFVRKHGDAVDQDSLSRLISSGGFSATAATANINSLLASTASIGAGLLGTQEFQQAVVEAVEKHLSSQTFQPAQA